MVINDLDSNICSNIFKFADDTKLANKVNNRQEKDLMQADLSKLVKLLGQLNLTWLNAR